MSEERLRERMSGAGRAVDVPQVDAAEVVRDARAGARTGRRRAVAMVAAAAAVAVIAAAAGVQWGLRGDAPTAGGPDSDRVPATPMALAALAEEVFGVEPVQAEIGDSMYLAHLGATVHVDEDNWISMSVMDGREILAEEDMDAFPEEECEQGEERCGEVASPAGNVTYRWQVDRMSNDGSISQARVRFFLAAGQEMRMLMYDSVSITGDPREADLDVPFDRLVALVADPRFGMSTSQALVDRELDYWHGPTEPEPEPEPSPEPSDMIDGVKAVVDEHLGSGTALLDRSQESDRSRVHVSLGLAGETTAEGWIDVESAEGVHGKEFCDVNVEYEEGRRFCESWETEQGTVTLGWLLHDTERDIRGFVTLLLQDDESYRLVSYTDAGIDGDPRDLDLPVGYDTMLAIVTDRRLSLGQL